MRYISGIKRENIDFTFVIKLFLSLVIINALVRLFGIFVPIALLFGPLQYYAHSLSKGRSADVAWLYHLIPFVLVSLSFKLMGPPLYLGLLTLSIFAYSVYVWIDRGLLRKSNQAERLIVLQIAAVSAVATVFIAILFLSSIGFVQREGIGFDPSYVLYGLLLVSTTILFGYFHGNKRAFFQSDILTSNAIPGRPRYDTYNMAEPVLQSYASKVEAVIDEKKLYLNAALSMDDLLHETGIPKHHLSQVFTVCLGKTFYQYIAEKRIEEAKLRMERNANITLEFLAFECGFNSKTTFNKYFKQMSSVTPSEYRSSLNVND